MEGQNNQYTVGEGATPQKSNSSSVIILIAILMFFVGSAVMYFLITLAIIPTTIKKSNEKNEVTVTKVSEGDKDKVHSKITEKETDTVNTTDEKTRVNEDDSKLITKVINSCKFSFNYKEGAFTTVREGDEAKMFGDDTVSEGKVLSGKPNSGDVSKLVSVSCTRTDRKENTYVNRKKVLDELSDLRTGDYAQAEIKEVAKEKKIGENTYSVFDYYYSNPMGGGSSKTRERLYTIVTPSYEYVINVLPMDNSDLSVEQAGLKFL